MAIENQVLKTASLTTIARTLSVIASIITLPLLLKSIGKDDYGLFVLIGSLTGYLGLMTFGATSTLKNKIVESYNQKDFYKVNLIISSVFSVYFLVYIFNLLIFSIISFFYPEFYYGLLNNYVISNDTKYVFYFLIVTTLLNTFVGSVIVNSYHGINKLNVLAKIQAYTTIFMTVFYIVFLIFEPSLLTVVVFNLLKSFILIIINYLFLKKNFIQLKIFISIKALVYFKELKKSSMYFFIASLLTIMTTSADYIMISKFYDTSSLAVFDISQKIYLIIASAFPIAYSSWPIVSKYYFANKKNALHLLFYKLIRLNILTKITFFLPAFLFYPVIVNLWLGENFVSSMYVYFAFFVIFANNVVLGIFSLYLSATENQKHLISMTFINLIVNIGSSLYIFYEYKIGLLSFLLGTIISQYVLFFLFILKYKNIFNKQIKIMYFIKYFLFFCFIGLIMFYTIRLTGIYQNFNSINVFVCFILLLIYFAYVFIFILRIKERKKLYNLLNRKKK